MWWDTPQSGRHLCNIDNAVDTAQRRGQTFSWIKPGNIIAIQQNRGRPRMVC